MTKNITKSYIALTGRGFRGFRFPTQGVAIGLYYVAPSGHQGKKQAESLIYSSPGVTPR
ncbi:hypothetical protein [Dysgonomonas reticulitermitis]